MTLPMWYIRNTIYPYGARPPKRPNITWVEPTEETRRHRGHFTPVGPVFFAKGNLEEHEYQFFIGKAWEQSTMGTCRCCNRTFYTKAERQGHFKTKAISKPPGEYVPSCAIKVISAMHLLQLDGNCVICDKRCTQRKWGFPLCSKPCIEAWMFADRSWTALQDALRLAEQRGWRS